MSLSSSGLVFLSLLVIAKFNTSNLYQEITSFHAIVSLINIPIAYGLCFAFTKINEQIIKNINKFIFIIFLFSVTISTIFIKLEILNTKNCFIYFFSFNIYFFIEAIFKRVYEFRLLSICRFIIFIPFFIYSLSIVINREANLNHMFDLRYLFPLLCGLLFIVSNKENLFNKINNSKNKNNLTVKNRSILNNSIGYMFVTFFSIGILSIDKLILINKLPSNEFILVTIISSVIFIFSIKIAEYLINNQLKKNSFYVVNNYHIFIIFLLNFFNCLIICKLLEENLTYDIILVIIILSISGVLFMIGHTVHHILWFKNMVTNKSIAVLSLFKIILIDIYIHYANVTSINFSLLIFVLVLIYFIYLKNIQFRWH